MNEWTARAHCWFDLLNEIKLSSFKIALYYISLIAEYSQHIPDYTNDYYLFNILSILFWIHILKFNSVIFLILFCVYCSSSYLKQINFYCGFETFAWFLAFRSRQPHF